VEVLPRFDLRSGNWIALLALWTALAAWLVLIGTGVAIGSGAASEDIFRVVGWILLGMGTAALVLSVTGITMIRTRGETALATLALVLTLAPVGLAGPVIFVIWAVEF
jgi:hypothetical protein